MPYIKNKQERAYLDSLVAAAKECLVQPGRINYLLFKLAKETCTNFTQYRNFIGEIETAKQEIYRRQVASYEDKKIEENGDVE